MPWRRRRIKEDYAGLESSKAAMASMPAMSVAELKVCALYVTSPGWSGNSPHSFHNVECLGHRIGSAVMHLCVSFAGSGPYVLAS
jgi:hypothetical protein